MPLPFADTYEITTGATGAIGVSQDVNVQLDNPGTVQIVLTATLGILSSTILEFAATVGPATVTFTPTGSGTALISGTNNALLIDSSATVIIPGSGPGPGPGDAVTSAYTVVTASHGTVGVPQNVQVELNVTGTGTVTLASLDGTFSSDTIHFSIELGPKVVTFTPSVPGTAIIDSTNDQMWDDPLPASVTVLGASGASSGTLVLSGVTNYTVAVAGVFKFTLDTTTAALTIATSLLPPDPSAGIYALDVGVYTVRVTWRAFQTPILTVFPFAGAVGTTTLTLTGTTSLQVTAADTYALSIDSTGNLVAASTMSSPDPSMNIYALGTGVSMIRVSWVGGGSTTISVMAFIADGP